MFNAAEAFANQFHPFDGGYVFYPSRNSGGKFLTAAEHEKLISDWQRLFGRAGRWKTVGVIVACISVIVLTSTLFNLPDQSTQIATFVVGIAMMSRIIWASLAPNRLVKNRDPVVPPRSKAALRREVRAVMPWTVIIVVILISSFVLWGRLSSPGYDDAWWWVWVVGSGAVLGGYLRLGFRKLRDR